MTEKEKLRNMMRLKLSRQKQSERKRRSSIIQNRLFNRKEFLASGCVMLYVSRGTGEVETGPIIKKALSMGKKVVLPKISVREKKIRPVYFKGKGQPFKKGPYGIFEPRQTSAAKPVRPEDIDLVIVPGLAFDRHNNRLGRGKGYYDNFLKTLPMTTPKIGLGFRFQVLDKIPVTRHDFVLTDIITD